MHPAHHEVEKSRKRREQMVQGRARGGALDRPGKKRAAGGSSGYSPEVQAEEMAKLRSKTYSDDPAGPPPPSKEPIRIITGPTSKLDQMAQNRGGEVKAAWDHVRRAYGGLVGGASEARDGQSTAKELEAHDRRGVPLLSAPERKEGGRLTMGERKKMPSSEFALPGKGEGSSGKGSGSYPVNDPKHARLALSMVSSHGSPSEKAAVRSKVAEKYPDIGKA